MSPKTTQFGKLLEAVPDALVGVDQKGVIRFVNRQTELLFGYDREQLTGEHIDMLAPEPLWQVYVEHREDYFADPGNRSLGLDLELIGRHQDGTEFPINVTMSLIDTGDVLLAITGVGDVTRRKQAVAKAELLDAIVEYSGDAIIGLTLDGIITSWNPAAERMYGYSSTEVIGRSDRLIPQERAGELDAVLARIKDGQYVEHAETTLVRKDGTAVRVSIAAAPIRDEDGAVVGTSAVHRDVTEQRRTFEAAQRMTAIVEGSDDAIIGETLEGVITSWNLAATTMFGYSSEEIIGKSVGLLIPEDQPGEAKAVVARISAGQHVEHVETFNVRKDGTVFPILLTVSPIRDADGAVVGASVICCDTTEQVQTARALATTSRQFRLLAENASDLVVLASPDRVITWVSPSVTRTLGWTTEDLLGTRLVDLIDPKDVAATAAAREVVYSGHAPATPPGGSLMRIRTKSGQYRWMSGDATPVTDESGVFVGVVSGLRDVDDLVRTREAAQGLSNALKTSNDSLRDFVAVASHDLRSPLVTIGGFTTILMDNWATLSDEARLKQLGAIKRGVDRLSRLTNDLLTSAKVDGAAEQTQPEHIRLATALASYLEANREELGTVAVTCPPALVAVADPAHLTRILDNYLDNAFKYGEPPICIEAELVGDFVELRVRDHGPGVPPEFVSRLFTKFDRVDTPTTRTMQGTGLGLSIVKALAEANHGDVRYQQDEPKGGCFVVRLPAAVS